MRHDESFEFRPRFDPNRNLLGGSGFESGISLSGNERNRLFLSRGGAAFEDRSGLSGIDHPADGRALAWLDYDRDGWLDLAVVNANAPKLQLFRNRLGDAEGGADAPPVITVRLVGAATAGEGDEPATNRDGVGARIEARIGDRSLWRERRAGEGFAAQNSATLPIGLGGAARAERVTVHWPSGRVQHAREVAAGTALTFFEDIAAAGNAEGVARMAPTASEVPTPAATADASLRLIAANGQAALNVYTTMATWCETCRGELPRVRALRDAFGEDTLALYAVPVDPDDTREKLRAYREENEPAYELLLDLPPADVTAVKEEVVRALRRDSLPASIVTDSSGRVRAATRGVPSLSELRRLLRLVRESG